MEKKIIEFNLSQRKKKVPDLKAGDIVKVHLKIKEGGKERIQIIEGLVIAIKGKQSSSPKITVRKISHGIGVEMVIPIYSGNVAKIELIKRAKVRRAKLYYVRGLTTKQSRMKYKDISSFGSQDESEPVVEKENTDEKSAEVAKDAKKEEVTTEAK
jgi:large subunit ribosomal protein L19